MARQVRGGDCRLVLYRESDLKVPVANTGVVLAINSESLKSGANKKQSGTIRGKRGPGKPFRGMAQLSGGIEMPAHAPQLGHMFRLLCGAPVTTTPAALACDAAAVTNKGGGMVGIPCTGHGYVQDATVSITGSTSYDGTYRVKAGTTTDEIVIAAPYVAESMTSGVKVHRGRVARLTGVAASGGGGTVVLSTTLLHGMHPGESVTIDGTTNYDGTYVLAAGTEKRKLVITDTFTAETFDGTPTVAPVFHRHVFTLPEEQPSGCIEKQLGFEAGAADTPYRRFLGLKINGMSTKLNEDNELVFIFDFSILEDLPMADALYATPAELPVVPLASVEGSLFVDGVRRGDVETCTVTTTYGMEAKAAMGDLGSYSRNNEGDPDIKLALSCFLENDELQQLADADATTDAELHICGNSGEEVVLYLPEGEFASDGAAITTKAGLMQDYTYMAFADAAASMLTVTLFNRVSSYA